MKKIACLILAFLLLVPVFGIAGSGSREVRLPVVMYHHISNDPAKWNDYVVSIDEFRADMDYLRENGWQSVSVAQLLEWYEGTFDMPAKPFMLTFDDGFESTLSYAEPIVADHGFTGTAAIIGSVCDKFTACDEHYPELSNLSWEDAAGLAEGGIVEIQCHTWDMHGLSGRRGCSPMRGEDSGLYCQRLEADLERFLSACREHGVDIVPAIAYPYGAFSGLTEQVVKKLGFRAAFTCEEKINVLTGQEEELYNLGRFNRPHGPGSEKFFEKWEENS